MPAEGTHIILKMTACHFLLGEHNLKLCINRGIMLFLISVFIVPLNLSQCPKCCENTAQLHHMSCMVWIILDLILVSKYEPTKERKHGTQLMGHNGRARNSVEGKKKRE